MCLKRNDNTARLRNAFALSRHHFNNDLISVSFVQCKLVQVYLDTRYYEQMDEVNHHNKKKYSWLSATGQMVFSTFAYYHRRISYLRITVSSSLCELLALDRSWISETINPQIHV